MNNKLLMLDRPTSSNGNAVAGMVVEVGSELPDQTLQRRSKAVNAILRLAILAGLQMELEATLGVFADYIAEIVHYDKLLVYFWQEQRGQIKLRLERGFSQVEPHLYREGNLLNLWANRYARPLVMSVGQSDEADAYLHSVQAASALVLPVIVANKNLGSLQLFGSEPWQFTAEDAQLLWIFSLVAENQLNREFANEGLLRFAFTDYLTGLRTRGYFEQQLDVEVKRAERKGTPLSLLMVDIDFFKPLNDQHGHHVGDQVLREVGLILQRDMRDLDTVARYGGEEFVLVLPETDTQGALQVAHRLRTGVEQAQFLAGSPDAVTHLTISVGLALFGENARDKQQLIQAADAALYEAKSRGRNQVVQYSELEPQARPGKSNQTTSSPVS